MSSTFCCGRSSLPATCWMRIASISVQIVLCALEEAALHVARDVEVEVVDDVDDALRGERRGVRVGDRVVEEREELLQRDLVHVVDRRHVDDQEVEQRAARGDGPVLLARNEMRSSASAALVSFSLTSIAVSLD